MLLMMLPLATLAHPGHGDTEGFSIIHYFSEPVHAAVSIIVLAVAGVVFFKLYSKKQADKRS